MNALAQIDAEIADTEQCLADLRLQRRGAEALLSRLGQSAPRAGTPTAVGSAPVGSAPAPRPITGTGNAAFVYAILTSAPNELSLADIETAARERGRPLNNDQVRSAVTYLKRAGRTQNVGRGMWRPADPTDAESPEAPGLSVLPPQPVESGTG
jgi:hypothetical protein